MPNFVVLAGLAFLALALPLTWWLLRSRRRDRALHRLLDLADEMQALLDRSQKQMLAMQAVVGRVPADIAAVAHASLDRSLPIRDAKRDILQHRLWIQKHSATASQAELDTACGALERARAKLSVQLTELERAGADLAAATEATAEAARREPPALRRDAGQP
ncbi:hypothetical protein [Arenimonas alkanexedens]